MMDLETMKRENEKVAAGGVPYWSEENAAGLAKRIYDASRAARADRLVPRYSASESLRDTVRPVDRAYTVYWCIKHPDDTITKIRTVLIPSRFDFTALPSTEAMWLDLAETEHFGPEGAPIDTVPSFYRVFHGDVHELRLTA